MATKIIGKPTESVTRTKKTRAKDAQMKPLANAYVKEHMDKNGTEHLIMSGKLTEKGFLLMQCKDFAILLPGGTEVATTILDDILPNLNQKKANRLVAVLNASNRFGADIGVTDDHQAYYCVDTEEETFFLSETKPAVSKEKPKKLSLEQFNIATD